MAKDPLTTISPDFSMSNSLKSRSFLGLLLTQWLGATNDNILRWLVIGIGKQYVEESQIGMVLMAGTACFVLPYLLLAAPAGYLADRYSKRTVIVACKLAEIAIMVLAVIAVLVGNIWLLFIVVALMGSQSALFGPSKLGSIPEMLRPEKISAANGLMGLTTVVATVAGMAVGNLLTDFTGYRGQPGWWLSGIVLVGFSIVGWLASLSIARLPPADPARTMPWSPQQLFRQTYKDLSILFRSRALLRVALGITFFWSLGALAQLNIDQFAFEGGATAQRQIVPLLIALVCGLGVGSVLAGILSGDHVELGILPLGAGGVAISAMLLHTVHGTLVDPASELTASYVLASAFLFLLGASAGLFDVPLEAFMQHRSPAKARGSVLAATNFLTFSGILVSALVFSALRAPWGEGDEPLLSAREIFLVCGAFTLPVLAYVVFLVPQATIRFLVWLTTHTIYRVRVYGRENLPETGGALLVANHVTWADGALLLATSSRLIRMLIWADYVASGWAAWLARTMGVIPIKPTPKSTRNAIQTARRALAAGELVCIFPEGGLTRSGRLQAFKPGLLQIIRDTDVPVIPVYLDELWGSIFSYESGKFFWKRPKRWPYPVSIWFGAPISHPGDVEEVRRAVQNLGVEAVQHRTARDTLLPQMFIRRCRRRLWKEKIADSSGQSATGGALLMRALILRRLLNRVLADDEKYVGILLPPTVGGVIVNAAVTLAKRISANLNYTVSSGVMNACIEQAKIRRVFTSRRVLEKLNLEINAEVICLEDLRDRVTLSDKIISAIEAYLLPAGMLARKLGLGSIDADDPMTVIFTSGSTGLPKGVLLTHRNILSNVEAIDHVVHLRNDDVILGILPFFHSFGFTVPLWTVLGLDVKGVYHFTPLDAKQVGKLCRQHGATVILATPTFLRSYIRRCSKEDFATLEVVVVGAEKMPLDLADAFEEKFGVRPVEGYGTTELSPIVSVNVPPTRSFSDDVDVKEGTVGRPVPGVTAKIVDPESWHDLPPGESGMLLVSGPNVMQGYLNQPEQTAEVIRDGWYVTGDIAQIDDDGFIKITGRQSRFSKIGGEMVPHVRIEEELQKIVGIQEDRQTAAVTAVPDQKKGERLVVLHTTLETTPEAICRGLADAGLPNLWIPSQDSFIEVEEIPVLGSGKLDLRSLKELAEERIKGKLKANG